jgi:hypothetical protein
MQVTYQATPWAIIIMDLSILLMLSVPRLRYQQGLVSIGLPCLFSLLDKTLHMYVGIPASCLEDSGFESDPWGQLAWGLVWFYSVCTGSCEGIVKQAVNISFQILSNSSFTTVIPWPMQRREWWKSLGSCSLVEDHTLDSSVWIDIMYHEYALVRTTSIVVN